MRHLSLLVLLVLSACVSTGTKVDQDLLSTFVKGKTTYSEVIQQLGKPDQSTTNASGATTITYTYKQSAAKGASLIPIVGGFFEDGAGAEDSTVKINFDNKSMFVSYSVTEADMETGRVKTRTNDK